MIRARLQEWGPRAAPSGLCPGDREPPGFRQRRARRLLRARRRRRRHHLRHRQHLPGRRSAARLHAAASHRMSATCTSRTIGCSSPTKATGWSAAPSATARCRFAELVAILAEHHTIADRGARTGRAGGAACALSDATTGGNGYPPKAARDFAACLARRAAQPAARRCRLPHPVGARGRRSARRLRAGHDPAQRRQHARAGLMKGRMIR